MAIDSDDLLSAVFQRYADLNNDVARISAYAKAILTKLEDSPVKFSHVQRNGWSQLFRQGHKIDSSIRFDMLNIWMAVTRRFHQQWLKSQQDGDRTMVEFYEPVLTMLMDKANEFIRKDHMNAVMDDNEHSMVEMVMGLSDEILKIHRLQAAGVHGKMLMWDQLMHELPDANESKQSLRKHCYESWRTLEACRAGELVRMTVLRERMEKILQFPDPASEFHNEVAVRLHPLDEHLFDPMSYVLLKPKINEFVSSPPEIKSARKHLLQKQFELQALKELVVRFDEMGDDVTRISTCITKKVLGVGDYDMILGSIENMEWACRRTWQTSFPKGQIEADRYRFYDVDTDAMPIDDEYRDAANAIMRLLRVIDRKLAAAAHMSRRVLPMLGGGIVDKVDKKVEVARQKMLRFADAAEDKVDTIVGGVRGILDSAKERYNNLQGAAKGKLAADYAIVKHQYDKTKDMVTDKNDAVSIAPESRAIKDIIQRLEQKVIDQELDATHPVIDRLQRFLELVKDRLKKCNLVVCDKATTEHIQEALVAFMKLDDDVRKHHNIEPMPEPEETELAKAHAYRWIRNRLLFRRLDALESLDNQKEVQKAVAEFNKQYPPPPELPELDESESPGLVQLKSTWLNNDDQQLLGKLQEAAAKLKPSNESQGKDAKPGPSESDKLHAYSWAREKLKSILTLKGNIITATPDMFDKEYPMIELTGSPDPLEDKVTELKLLWLGTVENRVDLLKSWIPKPHDQEKQQEQQPKLKQELKEHAYDHLRIDVLVKRMRVLAQSVGKDPGAVPEQYDQAQWERGMQEIYTEYPSPPHDLQPLSEQDENDLFTWLGKASDKEKEALVNELKTQYAEASGEPRRTEVGAASHHGPSDLTKAHAYRSMRNDLLCTQLEKLDESKIQNHVESFNQIYPSLSLFHNLSPSETRELQELKLEWLSKRHEEAGNLLTSMLPAAQKVNREGSNKGEEVTPTASGSVIKHAYFWARDRLFKTLKNEDAKSEFNNNYPLPTDLPELSETELDTLTELKLVWLQKSTDERVEMMKNWKGQEAEEEQQRFNEHAYRYWRIDFLVKELYSLVEIVGDGTLASDQVDGAKQKINNAYPFQLFEWLNNASDTDKEKLLDELKGKYSNNDNPPDPVEGPNNLTKAHAYRWMRNHSLYMELLGNQNVTDFDSRYPPIPIPPLAQLSPSESRDLTVLILSWLQKLGNKDDQIQLLQKMLPAAQQLTTEGTQNGEEETPSDSVKQHAYTWAYKRSPTKYSSSPFPTKTPDLSLSDLDAVTRLKVVYLKSTADEQTKLLETWSGQLAKQGQGQQGQQGGGVTQPAGWDFNMVGGGDSEGAAERLAVSHVQRSILQKREIVRRYYRHIRSRVMQMMTTLVGRGGIAGVFIRECMEHRILAVIAEMDAKLPEYLKNVAFDPVFDERMLHKQEQLDIRNNWRRTTLTLAKMIIWKFDESPVLMLYLLKGIRLVIQVFALFAAQKVFTESYMHVRHAKGSDPPKLTRMLFMFMSMDASMQLIVLLIIVLLSYTYKAPSNTYIIDDNLISVFLIEYFMSTSVIFVIGMLFARLMRKKRYFDLPNKGAPVGKAYRDVMAGTCAATFAVPFFLLF